MKADNKFISIEERLADIYKDRYLVTAGLDNGILGVIGCFLDTDYKSGMKILYKYICSKSFAYKDLVLEDFDIVLSKDIEDKILLEIGEYIETRMTDNRSMGFGSHSESREYLLKYYEKTQNNSFRNAIFIRINLEHMYIDLFQDDPDFKPELLKLVENKKTLGIEL